MAETIISSNGVYKLVLPEGYVLEENEQGTIVYNEQTGNGALNITSYRIPDDYSFDIEDELRDLVSSIDTTINSRVLPVKKNGFACCEFTTQDRFWKVWTFFKNQNAVFISYNCNEEEKEEINNIDKIITSLKIID
jgi:hypothetical protein